MRAENLGKRQDALKQRTRALLGVSLLTIAGAPATLSPAREFSGVASPACSGQKALKRPEGRALHARARAFLTAWLIQRQFDAALGYFSRRAWTSPVLLSEDCAGYIQPADRGHPAAVRAGTRKFLRELALAANSHDLRLALAVERLKNVGAFSPLTPVNRVESDHYLLLRAGSPAMLQDLPLVNHGSEKQRFLSQAIPDGVAYVMVAVLKIPDGEVAFYSVWREEKGRWRILHLDLICQ